MMAKMSHKMRQTSSTLKMLGMAWMRAFTTTCVPRSAREFQIDEISIAEMINFSI